MTDGTTTTAGTPASTPAAPEQTTATPTGQSGGATAATETISMTQAELDKLIAERLDRERAKSAKQADQARKAIEDQSLVDQAKWKDLAERRHAEVTALQEKAGLAERQALVIEHLYKTRLNGLSALVRKAVESLPADDTLARLTWLVANEALLKASSSVPDISAQAGGRQAGPGLDGLDAQQLASKYGVSLEAVQAYVNKGT